MSCILTPISAFQSTNLNSKITCFGRLADRIVRSLGSPLISIEVHQDQLFENIAIAVELFTRYAGYTKEYIVFDSNLYERGKGLRLDYLYTLADTSLSLPDKLTHKTASPSVSPYLSQPQTVYVATSAISSLFFSSLSGLSSYFTSGIAQNQLLDLGTYNTVLSTFATSPTVSSVALSAYFQQSQLAPFTIQGSCDSTTNQPQTYNNMFDYDTMDYRKVISVTDFEEGTSSGINTLFTIEQTLAQQTYFSYAMGNYGFDLISWYVLKDWLKIREKLLCTKRSYEFNDRTQYLRMYPEPDGTSRFYGILACYVERPIKDVIKEPWVYQYALALTKQTVSLVRGKFGSIPLFGGQMFGTDLFTQGQTEKEKLETELYEGAASALGAADPILMMVG